MAYKKNKRNNGGYKYNNRRNNNYKNNNYNPQKPAYTEFDGFDATQFKKPDINIKDLRGVVYTISGNFSTAFSANILKTTEQINKIRNNSNNIEKFPEIFDLLKEWCLDLINLNVDGKTYSMDDVNAGFNDIYVLYNLISYISKVVSASNKEIKKFR